ncbi:polysaccharide deacetylase family protein [Nocardiopsis alkaliphila]|uniref:polysaccharide deacetylase family protein n=1 Tax=Nocardiopsis alkaliphila TaxID=225762 RepID=UPI0005243F1A|nr:polysaccharide deacetylase family protein [Nocardiopsis alkaliphila]
MAPERPILTITIAMVVLLGLVLSTTRPPGVTEEGITEHVAAEDADQDRPPADSEDGLTLVDPGVVTGIEEASLTHQGIGEVSITYPVIPNAEPLTDFLDRTLADQVSAFEAANPGARSFEGTWRLSAARDGIVGVRFTTVETDSEETREGQVTYWYETDNGAVHGSNALLAGQAELAALNELVRQKAPDTVSGDSLHPISALYDSLGFTPEGDLVVEFGSGRVAPTSAGRIHVVVERDTAEELLSEFGLRAREAATTGVVEFTVDTAPEVEEDGSRPRAPGVLSPLDDGVDCSDPRTRCVALTYDDGPGGRTPELLDVLAEHDAKATFFVTGLPIMEHPWTVRRAYAEGHEIANHTLDHPDLAAIGEGAARSNLEATQALVYRETGYTMDLMRPPYGSTNDTVARITEELGLAQIIWSVDTNDWRDREVDVVAERALDGDADGAIILMHDIHDSTIDASRIIIRELAERGYTMVTVSQLLGPTEPGRTYVDGAPEEEGPQQDSDEEVDPQV